MDGGFTLVFSLCIHAARQSTGPVSSVRARSRPNAWTYLDCLHSINTIQILVSGTWDHILWFLSWNRPRSIDSMGPYKNWTPVYWALEECFVDSVRQHSRPLQWYHSRIDPPVPCWRPHLDWRAVFESYRFRLQLLHQLAHRNCQSILILDHGMLKLLCMIRISKVGRRYWWSTATRDNSPMPGRNMPMGKPAPCWWTTSSAMALVNVYVFGHLSNNTGVMHSSTLSDVYSVRTSISPESIGGG